MTVITTKKHGRIWVDIVAILNYYSQKNKLHGIKDSGGRDVQARCPNKAHDDNNPSWGINRSTGQHHCYGCDFRGDIFTLIRELESCSFDRSVELSMRISSSDISSGTVDSTPVIVQQKAIEDARSFKYYPDTILDSMDEFWDYFLSRGISMETCRQWELRYSQDRYIIPVRDIKNRIVGFIGAADDEQRAKGKKKYLNSPKLWISRILLGIHRYSICSGDRAILVEGPIDTLRVASFAQRDIAVLGILHSSLSPGQWDLIKQAGFKKLFLMADNDPGPWYDDEKDPEHKTLINGGEKLRRSVKSRVEGSGIGLEIVEYLAEDPGEASDDELRSFIS